MSKVPCLHWILTPRPKFHSVFALRPAIFEIQAGWKSECTEWPQNDLNHWSVKSILCPLTTRPSGPNFTLFRSMTSHFRDTGFLKIGNAPNDPRMTFISAQVSKVPCVHWILTPKAQISICFALRPGIFKIQACRKSEWTQWPQNDLNHWSVKSTLCTLNTHPQGPNFTPFRSTVTCFPDNWGFWFSHRVQWWKSKFVKNR